MAGTAPTELCELFRYALLHLECAAGNFLDTPGAEVKVSALQRPAHTNPQRLEKLKQALRANRLPLIMWSLNFARALFTSLKSGKRFRECLPASNSPPDDLQLQKQIRNLSAEVFGFLQGRESQQKRILICNVFFSPESYGGATKVVESSVSELCKSSSVCVLSTFSDKSLPAYSLRVSVKKELSIAVNLPGDMDDIWDFRNPHIEPIFHSLLSVFKPGIVHFHSIQKLGSNLIPFAAKAQVPTVVTLHDSWWLCASQFRVTTSGMPCPSKDLSPFTCVGCTTLLGSQKIQRSVALRRDLSAATVLAAPSHFQKSLYAESGFRESKIQVLPNPVSFPNRLPSQNSHSNPLDTHHDRSKAGSSNKVSILYVGGTHPEKGYNTLVSIIRDVRFSKETCFVLVEATGQSQAQEKMQKDLRNAILQRRVSNSAQVCFEVIDSYSTEQLDELFCKVQGLLVPSIASESFCLIAHEALVRKVPVLASRLGALPEVVEHQRNGYLAESSTISEWQAAIDWWQNSSTDFGPPEGVLNTKQHAEMLRGLYENTLSKGSIQKETM